jgi:O-antigen ligase
MKPFALSLSKGGSTSSPRTVFHINANQYWTALLLSLMLLLVPAVGVPHEELLQDTLKSIGVGFFALAATFAFFWPCRKTGFALRLHALLVLPLALLLYALGSMLWSHTYLAGVEAVRWFVFGLLVLLGMNSLSQPRVGMLAWCVHLGAVLAALWAALQFWLDWPFFAQGPNPASTFINRNFFAEFLVCTLPFSVLLLTRVQDKASVFLLTFSIGFNVVALMMSGTRSALVGLQLLLLLMPAVLWRYRQRWASGVWRPWQVAALIGLFCASVLSLGSLETHNANVQRDFGPGNALNRAFSRTLSITLADEYRTGSFSVRAQMWLATTRMIAAHPLAGVGAGAWEVQIPLYQDASTQVENDYYAHNEPLQLLAEYGLLGWLVLLLLVGYLSRCAVQLWAERLDTQQDSSPVRAFALLSLLMLLLVSNAGFPWRMASTGALFALSLGLLCATDRQLVRVLTLRSNLCIAALCGTAIASGLALYMAQQAIECEAKLVRAAKMALSISLSGVPNDPRWAQDKHELLLLLQQGVAINPHYRKLTPITADAVASWGDWKSATWIWESVLASRPHVVVLLANAARGHLHAGNLTAAQNYMARAQKIQPTAPALTSLRIMLLSRTAHEQEAMQQAQTLLQGGFIDHDLVQVAYFLGIQQQQPELAILALQKGIQAWPNRALDGWLKLGDIYSAGAAYDAQLASNAYTQALKATAPALQNLVLARIPAIYRQQLESTHNP